MPVVKPYDDPNGNPILADEYEIALIQYRTNFNSDLPDTLVRGYVQLETAEFVTAHPGVSQHYPLMTANVDPTKPDVPVLVGGVQAYGVTSPQWLGPTIAATKNKPVRVVFHNLLPTGAGGRPLPAGRQHHHGLRARPADAHDRSGRRGHRHGPGAQPRL